LFSGPFVVELHRIHSVRLVLTWDLRGNLHLLAVRKYGTATAILQVSDSS
jgi:hypothetical protein